MSRTTTRTVVVHNCDSRCPWNLSLDRDGFEWKCEKADRVVDFDETWKLINSDFPEWCPLKEDKGE